MKFEGFNQIHKAFVPVKSLQACFHNHVSARFAVGAFSPSLLYLSQSYAGLQLCSSCFGSYIYILSPPPPVILVMKKDVKMTSRKSDGLYLQKIWTIAPIPFLEIIFLVIAIPVQEQLTFKKRVSQIIKSLLSLLQKAHGLFLQ